MNACLKNPFTFYGLQMQSLVPPAPPFFTTLIFLICFGLSTWKGSLYILTLSYKSQQPGISVFKRDLSYTWVSSQFFVYEMMYKSMF